MWRLPLFTSVEIEIKQRGSPGKLPLRLKTCIQSCVFTALYENQSGCTVTFAKRTDCWSTNCDQGFWDIVFQGQPTKASGMGFGHFPQNNKSTAVNSNLYGSLLLLCFFENINNDNPFIELLAMCQVWITKSILFELLYLILIMGFTGGSDGKESACNVGDLGSVPGLERSPGGGHGSPLQCSCLENPHGQRSLVGYSP